MLGLVSLQLLLLYRLKSGHSAQYTTIFFQMKAINFKCKTLKSFYKIFKDCTIIISLKIKGFFHYHIIIMIGLYWQTKLTIAVQSGL
jgi:hypothetical protein